MGNNRSLGPQRRRAWRMFAITVAALLALGSPPAAAADGVTQPSSADAATPPSQVWAEGYTEVGLPDAVGWDSLRGSVLASSRLPHVEGANMDARQACVSALRHEIRSATRQQGGATVEVQVRRERREEGCSEPVDYRFDPVSSDATVTASIPTTVETRTWVRAGEGEPWAWEGQQVSEASATLDLTWTGTPGSTGYDSWVCFIYAPPFVQLCPKDYVLALGQSATVTGSVVYGGLGATLSDPPSGRVRWGAFLP